MENSKYYTPEIEEFYNDIEYQKRDLGASTIYTGNVYGRYIFDGDFSPYLLDKPTRVKILDKNDIESFDYKLEEKTTNYDYYINEGNKIGVTVFKGFDFPKVHIYSFIVDGRIDTLFFGRIKNKSEFKKILKMIG